MSYEKSFVLSLMSGGNAMHGLSLDRIKLMRDIGKQALYTSARQTDLDFLTMCMVHEEISGRTKTLSVVCISTPQQSHCVRTETWFEVTV